MPAARLYPIFADLAGRRVLVVGGGSVAERKVAALLEAGAAVEAGAPAFTARLAEWAAQGLISLNQGRFADRWLDGQWLVIAATGDPAVNAAVAAAAQRQRTWCNVVDDAALSSFQVPAVIDRSPLVVAVSTAGAAPVLARLVREKIESLLDPSLGAVFSKACCRAASRNWCGAASCRWPKPHSRRNWKTLTPRRAARWCWSAPGLEIRAC